LEWKGLVLGGVTRTTIEVIVVPGIDRKDTNLKIEGVLV